MGETDPWIGRVIDERYRIEAIIGRGGFGAVYRGTHLGLDRPVALKRIRGGDDELVVRFEREAKLQARLRHPVCVMVHDFVRDGDTRWLVQEFVDGRELKEVLAEASCLEADRAVHIACRLLEGLGAAHALAIIHRDIKPGNIMLVRTEGREDVRLLDFGIAREATADDTCVTSPGVIVGTPRYISPEQARGEPPTAASDIYAVGLLLYHMLAGQPPFSGREMREAIIQHLTRPPPPLPPDVSPRLAAVVMDALAKEPAGRPPTAEAMIDRLRAALRAPSNDELRPPPERPPAAPTAGRRHRLALGLSLAAGAALAASVLITGRSDHQSDPAALVADGGAPRPGVAPAVDALPSNRIDARLPTDAAPPADASPADAAPADAAPPADASPADAAPADAAPPIDAAAPPARPRPPRGPAGPAPAPSRATRIAHTRSAFAAALDQCDCRRAHRLLTRLDTLDPVPADRRAMLLRCTMETSQSCHPRGSTPAPGASLAPE